MTIQHPAAKAALAFRKIILVTSVSKHHYVRSHSRNGKVPWNQSSSNTNRLLHSKDTSSRSSRCADRARDSLCFASEPPRETQRIIKLSLGLEKWLSSLIGNDVSEIISVLANQSVPLQEPLRTLARVDFLVAFKRCVRCGDGSVDVVGIIVGCRSPKFAGPGI
jgi:hypothetical protein